MKNERVRAMLREHGTISDIEKDAIETALNVGAMYGYGNVMAWLATEWACDLRDRCGMKEETAIASVSGRGPYSLPNVSREAGEDVK